MELSHDQKINLVGMLLLHRKKRDDALGIGRYTIAGRTYLPKEQAGLVWYLNLLNAQKVGAELYQPVIKKLVQEAETATPERQAEILATVEHLQERIELGLVGDRPVGHPNLIQTYKGWTAVIQGGQDG